MEIISRSPRQTINLGKRLSKLLKKGDIILLFGEFGSGKTTFVKGIAEGLGVKKNKVNSPSFVLINEFKGRLPLFHFDLYRLNNLQEIFSLGFEEYLFDDAVSVIEWAQRLKPVSFDRYLKVHFKLKGGNKRLIKITKRGSNFNNLIKAL